MIFTTKTVLKLFEAFSIQRWNDLIRPFEIVEMDKTAEKTFLAYIIGKYEEKKAVINRLSKAAGHIEAIKRMVENDEDCSQVLIQLAAVRAAINNTGNTVLKNHISHCIVEAVEQGDTEAVKMLNSAIDMFVK